MTRRVIPALAICVACAGLTPPMHAQDATSQERSAAEAAAAAEKLRNVRELVMLANALRNATRPQQFSVVLVVSSVLTDPPAGTIPSHARKALEDMKAFLPFKSYRLFGTTDVTQQPGRVATARISGGDNQVFELSLFRHPETRADARVSAANGSATRVPMSLTFILKDVTGKPDPSASDAGVVMNTLVTMEVGETIVVGTSRVGGSRGLLALLTALPPAAPNGR